LVCLLLAAVALPLVANAESERAGEVAVESAEAEVQFEAEAETDASTETEAEVDTEGEAEVESESETETEAETEADTETESDSDAEGESETDADAAALEAAVATVNALSMDGPSFIPPPVEDLFITPDQKSLKTYDDFVDGKVGAVVFSVNPKKKRVVTEYSLQWPVRKFDSFRNEFVKANAKQCRFMLLWVGTERAKAKTLFVSWMPDYADEWETVVYSEVGKTLRSMFQTNSVMTATEAAHFTAKSVKAAVPKF